MSDRNLSYKKAISELEDILNKIENEELDVDDLTSHVKKASELIKFCKDKLRQTEKDVEKILDDINPEWLSNYPIFTAIFIQFLFNFYPVKSFIHIHILTINQKI